MLYLCTYDNLDHILYHFDIPTINILIDIINGKEKSRISTYIEAQIHGDVDITRDIENIRLPKYIYQNNKEKIDRFINTYPNIDILIY
jgi:hypothetical protein